MGYSTLKWLYINLEAIEGFGEEGYRLRFSVADKVEYTNLFKKDSSINQVVHRLAVELNYFFNKHSSADRPLFGEKEIVYSRKKIKVAKKVGVVIKNYVAEIDTQELFVEIASKVNEGAVVLVYDENSKKG